MPRPLQTYDGWLALSDQERSDIMRNEWDIYARDGIAIAYMAAARVALAAQRKILDIQIGTYHGGEYVLQLTVSKDDCPACPPMLTQTFEGFRVIWQPQIP